MKYYAETGLGCCICEEKSLKSAKLLVLREVGTYTGVSLIRKATEEDIEWVRGMGGCIPD